MEEDQARPASNYRAPQLSLEFPNAKQLQDAVAEAKSRRDLLNPALLFSMPNATKLLEKPVSTAEALQIITIVQDFEALVKTFPQSEDKAFCLALIAHFDTVRARYDQAEVNYKKSIAAFQEIGPRGFFSLDLRDLYTRRSYTHGLERSKIALALLFCKQKKIAQAEQIYTDLMANFYKNSWLPFGYESKNHYASQLDGNDGAALSALAGALGRAYDEAGQTNKAAEKFNDLLAFNEIFEHRQQSNIPEPEPEPKFSLASAWAFLSASGSSGFSYNDEAIIGAYKPRDQQMVSFLDFDSKHHSLCKPVDTGVIRERIEFFRRAREARAHKIQLVIWNQEETASLNLLSLQPKLALQQWKEQIKLRKAECISDPELRQSLNMIGYQLIKNGSYSDAEPFLTEAVALGSTAGKPGLATLGNSCSNLGLCYIEQSRLAEARPLLEKALLLRADDENDPFASAKSKIVFAKLLAAQDQFALAEAQLLGAVRILGRHHYPLALPDQEQMRSRMQEYMADRQIEESVQMSAAIFHVLALIELGSLYTTEGKYGLAKQTLQSAIDSKAFSLDATYVPRTYEKLGRLALATGNVAEAKTDLAKAEALAAGCHAPRPVYADIDAALGDLNRKVGKKKEAEAYYAKAAGLMEDMLGPKNVRVIAMRKLANSRF
jgi:hypothetical protein